MIYTLEQLSKGEVACINDGTYKQLQAVLSAAEGEPCEDYYGKYGVKYYFKDTQFWNSSDKTDLPTQSVVEFYKQLQLQNTMKQYLTRKQLIELHKADDCKEWKSIIGCYLNLLVLEHDDFKIEIKQCDINLAKTHCNAKQTELLLNAGIVFKKEIVVCDSKDGDCIETQDAYYLNRYDRIIVFYKRDALPLTFGKTNLVIANIKGTLVKEPLTLQIKIN